MGQDWSAIAPYRQDGVMRWPNYAGDLTATHSQPINPYATFTVQLYWHVLGMARFQSTYDQRFVEESQIWVEGTTSAPDIAPDAKYTWRDPMSGTVYGARKGFVGQEPYGGATLLQRAADMETYSTFCDGGENCQEPQGDYTRESVTLELRKTSQLIRALSTIQVHMRFGNPYSP